MLCEFTSDGQFCTCSKCGWRIHATAKPIRRNCPAAKPPRTPLATPSLPRQATRYVTALARWTTAGRPTRDAVEVERIFTQICQPCEKFNGTSCSVCGCRVNRDQSALRNKIAMGTEHCPLVKW